MAKSIYLGLFAVFAASMVAVWLLPLSELLKGMVVAPGVGALIGALFQLARDSSEFERQKHLQSDQ